MKLGVFDSGVGGLTVARALQQSGLFSELLYYGDTARVPYGNKDKSTVTRYALEAVEFFNGAAVDGVVVACNTVSVTALATMQEYSNKPVYGVVEPGVLALQQLPHVTQDTPILIIATRSTIQSGVYQQRLAELGYGSVQALATPMLVPIVEEALYSGPVLEAALHHYFAGLPRPEVVVLGCTHFPLIATPIAEYFGGARTIHSGEAMVRWLQQQLQLEQRYERTPIHILASENVAAVRHTAVHWGLTDL